MKVAGFDIGGANTDLAVVDFPLIPSPRFADDNGSNHHPIRLLFIDLHQQRENQIKLHPARSSIQ